MLVKSLKDNDCSRPNCHLTLLSTGRVERFMCKSHYKDSNLKSPFMVLPEEVRWPESIPQWVLAGGSATKDVNIGGITITLTINAGGVITHIDDIELMAPNAELI